MAKDMLVEASIKTIASSIAFEVTDKTGYRAINPIPENHLREYLSDLSSLGLIRPSEKNIQ